MQEEKALKVIKWGVIHVDKYEERKFAEMELGKDNTRVTHLWEEEALTRNRNFNKYIARLLS